MLVYTCTHVYQYVRTCIYNMYMHLYMLHVCIHSYCVYFSLRSKYPWQQLVHLSTCESLGQWS